jgi:hypothetical protein
MYCLLHVKQTLLIKYAYNLSDKYADFAKKNKRPVAMAPTGRSFLDFTR